MWLWLPVLMVLLCSGVSRAETALTDEQISNAVDSELINDPATPADNIVVSAAKTDWEIERAIEDELYWSPYVDSYQVEVEVEDGTAELSGAVDTWAERQAAEKNALEGGAINVDNQLLVAHGPAQFRP
jgi:osmotically-inducible protein OsmY